MAEFVVPRSIPITFGMSLLLLLSDRDQRWADDPVVQSVRFLVLFDDGSFWLIGFDVGHRLMQIRIERFAERVDGLEPLRLEYLAQLALHQPHPLDPRLSLQLIRDRRERAVVAIEHIEQLRSEE